MNVYLHYMNTNYLLWDDKLMWHLKLHKMLDLTNLYVFITQNNLFCMHTSRIPAHLQLTVVCLIILINYTQTISLISTFSINTRNGNSNVITKFRSFGQLYFCLFYIDMYHLWLVFSITISFHFCPRTMRKKMIL